MVALPDQATWQLCRLPKRAHSLLQSLPSRAGTLSDRYDLVVCLRGGGGGWRGGRDYSERRFKILEVILTKVRCKDWKRAQCWRPQYLWTVMNHVRYLWGIVFSLGIAFKKYGLQLKFGIPFELLLWLFDHAKRRPKGGGCDNFLTLIYVPTKTQKLNFGTPPPPPLILIQKPRSELPYPSSYTHPKNPLGTELPLAPPTVLTFPTLQSYFIFQISYSRTKSC